MKTMSGEEWTPGHGHTGYPMDAMEALYRVSKGLPVYCPKDPSAIDQRPFQAFAAERGPNTS